MKEKIHMEAESLPKNAAEEKEVAKKISKSLNHSIKDGNWWAVMTGFGETYLPTFAVFLNATTLQMSYLTSIPKLLSAMLQIWAVKITNIFKSRKKIVFFFSLLQGFIWLFILAISYMTRNLWMLIILASLYHIFGSMAGPAWASWMGDLVKEDIRGKFFGKRKF